MARYVEAIQYRADISEVKARLAELRRETAATERAAERDTSAMSGHWGRVGKALGAVTLAATIGVGLLGVAGAAMGGFGLRIAAQTEQAEIGFTTLLGSGERAKAFLEELQAFAATTPFELPQLRDAASRLLAVGVTTAETIPLMRALGDATSAMGTGAEGIDRAVTALTQMRQKGKVTAEEMLQLAEAGIPAWDALAAKLGTDVAGAQAKVTAGQVQANDLFAALSERAGPAMQRVSGMMEQQSQSLLGLLSTLRDVVSLALGDMMGPAVGSIKAALPELTGTIQEALGAIAPHMTGLVTGVVSLLSGLLPALVPILGQVAGLFGHAFAVAGPIIASLVPHLVSVMDALAPLAKAVIDALLPALGMLLPPITSVVAALGQALTPIVEALSPIVSQLASVIGGFIQRLADTGILQRVGEALGRIFTAVEPLIEVFTELALEVFDALMPLLDPLIGLFEQVADALAQIMPELKPVIAQMGEALVAALVALVPALIPLIEVLAELLVAVVPIIPPLAELTTMWVNVIPVAAEAAGFIVGVVVPALERLTMVVEIVIGAIGGMISAVAGVMSALPGVISGWVGAVYNAALGIGRAIVDAVRDGVTGAIGLAADLAAGLVNALRSAWNAFATTANDLIPDEIGMPWPLPDINLPDDPIPRFHTGGVAGDDMLAVLRRDEVVFTPEQMTALGRVIANAVHRGPQIGTVQVMTAEHPRAWFDESLWRVA